MARALDDREVAVRRPLFEGEWRSRQLWLTGALTLTITASVAGYLVRSRRGPTETPTAAAPAIPVGPVVPRRSVALLGFKNLSGRPDVAWLSTALSEMLTTELAAGGKLRTVPGENVARMKVELQIPEAESLARDTLARVRQNLGTDLVGLGSYLALGGKGGGQIRLDLRLQDASTGEMVGAVSERGNENKLLDLVSGAGTRLRQQLGITSLAPAEAAGITASLPGNPQAVRFYSDGLARLRSFDALNARELLQRAAAADPRSPLIHSALAQAWSELGYDGRAKEEAKKALDLSAGLGREERLLIEGRYREMAREWPKAVDIYRTLWGFFPDNLEYGLRLASAQASAGKGKEALAAVEQLQKLPPPASADPRVDLVEARAARSIGDFKRWQRAAARAGEKGQARGARLLVASARLMEADALEVGEPQKALAACKEAKQIYAAAGDRGGVARSLIRMGIVLRYQGDLDGAKRMAEEALRVSRRIGDRNTQGQALSRIASVAAERGRLREALRIHGDALALSRELGDGIGELTAVNNSGECLRALGELSAAKSRFEASVALSHQIGYRRGVAFGLRNIGFVLDDLGELAEAKARHEEALGVSREIGFKSIAAHALFGLGQVLLTEGDLNGARSRLSEALTMLGELGQRGREAEAKLALATVLLEERRPLEAEGLIAEALEEFQSEKTDHNEALAHALRALTLLDQRRPAEAESAIARAKSLSEGTEHSAVQLRVALAAARVGLASAQAAKAVTALKTTLAEATRTGHYGLQLEARLALGELEVRYGDAMKGHADLAALEKEAQAKGFGLVARKAARSLVPVRS